ncbi:hypothetical protein ScPMuIL_011255 [Solemya velum]
MAFSARTTQASRRRKRPQPPIFSGVSGSYDNKDNDFVCPICFDLIDEAHITKCGHTFCYKCIKQSLETTNRCPKCNYVIEGISQLFPNFVLNELVLKHKAHLDEKRFRRDQKTDPDGADIVDLILEDNLDLANINHLMDVLHQKKQQLEADGALSQNFIIKEFLRNVRQKKQEQLKQLQMSWDSLTKI